MHTFKEQTGYSIGSYLSTKRLLLAKELILSGKPITDVCYECGFKNYSTFSRAYKMLWRISERFTPKHFQPLIIPILTAF